MAWEDAGLTLAQRDLGSLTLQVRRSKFEVITIHICRYIFLSVHRSERSWLAYAQRDLGLLTLQENQWR